VFTARSAASSASCGHSGRVSSTIPLMLRLQRLLIAAFLLALPALTGCPTEPPPRTPEDFGVPMTSEEADPQPKAPAKAGPSEDAPEISRSRGEQGGVVVLWPRVWPRDDDNPALRELATQVQKQLAAIAAKAAPGRPVDVRPGPERVCPRDGCAGTSVGAVLIHRDKACALVAVVSGPGTSPARILPWAGEAKLAREVVPFREPPEEGISVDDYASCAKLLEGGAAREAAITDYVKGLIP